MTYALSICLDKIEIFLDKKALKYFLYNSQAIKITEKVKIFCQSVLLFLMNSSKSFDFVDHTFFRLPIYGFFLSPFSVTGPFYASNISSNYTHPSDATVRIIVWFCLLDQYHICKIQGASKKMDPLPDRYAPF